MRAIGIAMCVAALTAAPAAVAQDAQSLDLRVMRLEKELNAVQRKVFPDGAGRTLMPEVQPAPTGGPAPGLPGPGALTDLTRRVDALEASVANLTGQVERQDHQIHEMEGRLKTLEARPVTPPPTDQTVQPAPASVRGTGAAPNARRSVHASDQTDTPRRPRPDAAADDARRAAVAAIDRPSSGNDAADDYGYGYRLWNAHFYPEAEEALSAAIKKHPKGPMASRTRNLLGRAYLDDGKPATSTRIFLENYQADAHGDRAPDSLYYLGIALTQLKQNAHACEAYAELSGAYPDVAQGRLARQLAEGRSRARCK